MRFESIRALAVVAALAGVFAAGSTMAARPATLPGQAESVTPVTMPLGIGNHSVNVVVQMTGKSVSEQQADAGRRLSQSEKDAIKQQIKAQHDGIKGGIAAAGGTVVADYASAINGIRVSIPQANVAQLTTLPGVTSVKPLQLFKPTNARSVPFIGAPIAWQDLGVHGEHVKLAIIDTGIDYTHANFNGPGTIAAYQAAHANEALPADPALFGPNAPRVKGGTDLVGDSYDPDPSSPTFQPTPHPDPNPLDCNGHGSHVAGTAAGSGVKADGTAFNGPYNATTVTNPGDWIIGPGVAPRADIYSVRVFGCQGSTDVVVDAIDWAVDHDMDVISMSLGSPFGTSDDPSALASTNAAKAGVVVVAAAGNNGLNQYVTGSPASGDGVISVAANDSTASFPGALVTIPAGTKVAIDANGFSLPPTTTYTNVKVLTAPNQLGCSVAAFGGPLAPNTLVVVQRGVCARVAKAIFGQQAGAAAVLMVNNANGLPPFEGPITSNPDDGVPFTVTIPFLGVSLADGGAFAAANGAKATVVPANLANPTFKQMASFSSGGPRNMDSALKPDITAPGVGIFSTGVGTGNGAANISGTSMATPHVSGSAALTVQAHPTWSVADIKAAVVNTGAPTGVAGFRISSAGTGLVQPGSSTKTQVVAEPNGDKFGVALNFGMQELTSDFSANKTIQLSNNGSTAATFTVSNANSQGSPHTVSFNKTTVTVPAHGNLSLNVSLNVPVATVGSASTGDALSFQEVSGIVQFTPATASDNNGVTLRVPYYLVPRSRSSIDTDLGKLAGTDPSTTATVTNKHGAVAGSADFYAWGIQDGKDGGGPKADGRNVTNDVRAVGMQSFPITPTLQLMVFAVNTWKPWSSPATNEFDIAVDVDGDGVADYVIVAADDGAIRTGSFSGVLGTFVFSTRSAGASSLGLATAPTDGTIAELPVISSQFCRTGEPCLSASNPRIAYTITSFDLINGGTDTVDGTGTINVFAPSISTGGFAVVPPNGTDTSNTISVNSAEFAVTPALGVMVVTLDNQSGANQADLIKVDLKK